MNNIIDAHIHLDLYKEKEIEHIMESLESARCTDLVSVFFHLESCRKNLELAKIYPQVKPAFGFHPEQELLTDHEAADLFQWMEANLDKMVAVGEVGLPYYSRIESEGAFSLEGYTELLDAFLRFSKKWDKPVVLHAVYDDAPIVCNLLEKHSIKNAHFHWFKGDNKTIERMIQNGYHISITPDVMYEEEIQRLVARYPLQQMMVETDGPWQFESEFAEKITQPNMIHRSVEKIAEIKQLDVHKVYEILYRNTKGFYQL